MGSLTDEVDSVAGNKTREWMGWAVGARACPGQRHPWRWYEGKNLGVTDRVNALSEACENTNRCEKAVDSRCAGVVGDDSW